MAFTQPSPLTAEHALDDFVCGQRSLEDWLKRYAFVNQAAGFSRTFVVEADGHVVGYYALSAASVEFESAPDRIRRGLGRYPIPAILLARLAVHVDHQGQGLGSALLKDAMVRTGSIAEQAGVRVLLVHALHERAAEFYRKFGFEPSPTDPLHLMLLMKDLVSYLKDIGYLR